MLVRTYITICFQTPISTLGETAVYYPSRLFTYEDIGPGSCFSYYTALCVGFWLVKLNYIKNPEHERIIVNYRLYFNLDSPMYARRRIQDTHYIYHFVSM